jgi:hypothetical protein
LLKEQLRKEVEEIERQKGRLDEKLNIAKLMKQKGYTSDQIVDLTGLSPEQVKKLK